MIKTICRKREKDAAGNWKYQIELIGAEDFKEAKEIVEKAFDVEEVHTEYYLKNAELFTLKGFSFEPAKVQFIKLTSEKKLWAYVEKPKMFFTLIKDAVKDEFNLYGAFEIKQSVQNKYVDVKLAALKA